MSSELKTNKISPATGTALQISDSGDTTTIPSGATLAIASGATIANSGTATGFGSDNTPMFMAYMSTDTSGLSDGVHTKVAIDTELVDTDSAYDTSAYRFTVPSGAAGKYYIFANIAAGSAAFKFYYGQVSIYKNGSSWAVHSSNDATGYGTNKTMTISSIMDLSVADYIEVYGMVNTHDGTAYGIYNMGSNGVSNFGGFKLI